jgi:hypothetical protein
MTMNNLHSAEYIHHIVFHNRANEVSLKHIKELQRRFRYDTVEDINHYLSGKTRKRGRKRKLDEVDDALVADLSAKNKGAQLWELADLYAEHSGNATPSKNTIDRSLKRSRITFKRISTQSRLSCPIRN